MNNYVCISLYNYVDMKCLRVLIMANVPKLAKFKTSILTHIPDLQPMFLTTPLERK